MSEQPEKKEAGPTTDPTPPQTLHGNGDPEKGVSEVQETKATQQNKKREYKEFTHDEGKATRASYFLLASFSRPLTPIRLADDFFGLLTEAKVDMNTVSKNRFRVFGLYTTRPV
jgi:hypothetical protein